MSLMEQVGRHATMESYFARRAVQGMQSGAPAVQVRWDLEDAARERHLAYELADTDRIAWNARAELSGVAS